MMEEILRAAATKQLSILQSKDRTDRIRCSSVRVVECTQTIKGQCAHNEE